MCSERVWEWANVLRIGALVVPGERTVAVIVRAMGCSDEKPFQNAHRVRTRATGSSRERSCRLLVVVALWFVPGKEPLVLGIDETIERRGVSRDPVRSSQELFVQPKGWRWISMMRLAPIPWATRVGAFPFLTVGSPSERSPEERHRRQKTLTDGAWHMIRHVTGWLPGCPLVVVADGTDAVQVFLGNVSRLVHGSAITRVRLDACLDDPAPSPRPGQTGRQVLKGKRQPTLADRLHGPHPL